MRFSVLGDVLVESDEGVVAVPGRTERLLLTHLLAARGTTVDVDALIEALWGTAPPRTAMKSLQAHVVRLRDALEPSRPRGGDGTLIQTRPGGYALSLDDGTVDADRFEALVGDARSALASGAASYAATTLRSALALWRDATAFAGADGAAVRSEAARLEELRRTATEDRVEADLASGLAGELVAELRRLVEQEPLRERRWGQLALALYRDGRQGEALEALTQARQALATTLGVDPGPELQALQAAILAQDPALDGGGPPRVAVPPELDVAELPLEGRDAEIGALRDFWAHVRGGAGRVLLLAGQTGSGRTRLAAELAAQVDRERGLVLYGSAVPVTSEATVVLRRLARALELGGGDGAVVDAAGIAERIALHGSDRGTLAVLDDLAALDPLGRQAVARAVAVLRARPVGVVLIDDVVDAWQEVADEVVAVGAVGRDAALRIALGHTSPDDAELAVADVLRYTAPLPGPLHDAVQARARRRADEQVTAAAVRVRDQSAQLDHSRAALAALVSRPVAGVRRPTANRDRCPYKGLERFGVGDADVFFGREELLAELLARLVESPLLALVGPSGCGKSSLLRAGLLAGLAGASLPDSDRWEQLLLRPGSRGMVALTQLPAAPGGTQVVVAVDQLEEVRTAFDDPAERQRFLDAVVDAARRPGVTVVVTVRSDKVGELAAHAGLAALLERGTAFVEPMSPADLRRVVELPASRVGLRVEPGLSSTITADVSGQPGALPLLSTALLELWEGRRGDALTLAAYQASGGVRGAVARLAESVFGQLGPAEQAAARRMLLRMTAVSDGDVALARRMPLAEVAHEGPAGGRALRAFVERRLVTVADDAAEVAHEALLQEWPRLREWLEEDRHGRAVHRHLTEAAARWERGDRDPADLYRGARLASSLSWAEPREAELSPSEQEFLAASSHLADRERADAQDRAERQAAANRRLRWSLSAATALLVVALVAGGVAAQQRSRALTRGRAADAARVGAQALVEDDLDRSLLLAVQALRLDDSIDTRGTLLEALTRSPDAVGVFRGDGERFMDADVSPDGRLLAAAASTGVVTVWDVASRRRTLRTDATAESWSVGFSPDGAHMLVGGWSDDDQGLVRLYETEGFTQVWSASPAIGGMRFDWSPDGRRVVAMGFDGKPVVLDAANGSVTTWDVDSGDAASSMAVFSADGETVVASYDGVSVLLDAATGQQRHRLPVGGAVAASPDGRWLAVAERGRPDRRIVLVDPATGDVSRALVRHTAEVNDVVFTPDSEQLVSAGDDGLLVVWDVASGESRAVLQGHRGRVHGLSVTDDGRTLASASLDGSAMLWDLTGQRRFGRRTVPEDVGMAAAAAPDGTVVASARPDGLVLFDRAAGTSRTVPVQGEVFAVAAGADGTVAAAGEQGDVTLVDGASGTPRAEPLSAHGGAIGTLRFSDDGRTLLAGTERGVVVGWDTGSWAESGRVELDQPVWSVGLDASGRQLAVGLDDGSVAVVSWPGGDEVLRTSPTGQPELFLTFDGPGRTVISGGRSGLLRRWDAADGSPVGEPLRTAAGWVLSGDVRGDVLVVGSSDGTISLLDLPAGRFLGGPLPVVDETWVFPSFLPDGRVLALADIGAAVEYDVDVEQWVARACAVAGRTLDRHEWLRAFPSRPYEPACT